MQNHNNQCADVLLDYLVLWLPSNINKLYAHSTLCVHVISEDNLEWLLYYTSQIDGHSTLWFCWCISILRCSLNDVLDTSQF
jgi:hypothetical protein